MKNWDTLEADENLLMNTHYTPGRSGRNIDKIVIHHNAGNLSIAGCYNLWQTREASAHYQVDANGRIGQLVWDADTAWHADDWDANITSIGVEHADINTNPWTISDATLDNGAHLVAALCKYYGLGRPQWCVNVFPHSRFSATECPTSLAGTQNAAYMAKAQQWYDSMTGGTPAPTPSQPATHGTNLEALADAVIRGDYGNGDERKQRGSAASTTRSWQSSTPATESPPTPLSPPPTRRRHRRPRTSRHQRRIRCRRQPGKAALGSNYEAVQARVNQLTRRRHRHQQHRPERIGGCGHPWRLRQRRSTPSRTRSQLQRRAGARQQETRLLRKEQP